MYLENIYSPADVKKLSVKELNELSDEIRVSLLQKLTWRAFRTQLRNGGSNYCLALCIQFSKR